MTLLLLIIIAYYLFVEPLKAKILTLVFAAHTFGGRAAGVGVCIINGLNFFQTFIYNFFIEIQLLCLIYSIFVLTIRNYIKVKWVIRIANQMMHNADKYKEKIEKYGWIGLFIFVLAPFPGSGPVGGSILGYLLKMSIWRNFSSVLLGTLSAIIIWVFCFDFLKQNINLIQYVICGIVVVFLFYNFRTIKEWFIKQD
ncbi:MAG: small multi-drug export protein [Desulfamplus sp.]|nr:small multi-drug export protein [Desulfamplus sp.]